MEAKLVADYGMDAILKLIVDDIKKLVKFHVLLFTFTNMNGYRRKEQNLWSKEYQRFCMAQ